MSSHISLSLKQKEHVRLKLRLYINISEQAVRSQPRCDMPNLLNNDLPPLHYRGTGYVSQPVSEEAQDTSFDVLYASKYL